VKPDLVVTDHSMPEMTGAQLCAELRSDPATARLPVLVLTAFHRVDRYTPEYAEGPTTIMSKPFRPLELLQRVAAILGPTAERAQPQWKTDPISGLVIVQDFEAELSRRLAAREPLGIALLHVSGLEQVEELNGRLVRDRTMATIARRLEEVVRSDDLCARLEGDTLAVLLRSVDMVDARAVAERAVQHLSATSATDALPAKQIVHVRLLAHGGVAVARPHETAEELLTRCRAALRQAEAVGRGEVEAAE
jgi:diguanylate cyclase (GGDEF)-like protein